MICVCEKPKLAESSLQQLLLMLGVAWVHLFCPWNVDEGRTKRRYVWRYGLEWLEFVAVIVCLYSAPGRIEFPGKYIFIIVASCCYAVGILIMCLYYGFCHPNSTLERRRYPPLVVVYTPPEKASVVGDSVPSPLLPVVVPVPEPGAAVVRPQGRIAYDDDGDVGCCGGGIVRNRGGGVSIASPANTSIRSTGAEVGSGGGGGCDGGWGSTNDGGGGGGHSHRSLPGGGGGGFDSGRGCDFGGGGGNTGGGDCGGGGGDGGGGGTND